MDKKINSRKNLISILVVIILLLAIPVLMYLISQVQIFKPKAAGEPILFTGPNVIIRGGVQKLKLDDKGQANVGLVVTSPIGPPNQ